MRRWLLLGCMWVRVSRRRLLLLLLLLLHELLVVLLHLQLLLLLVGEQPSLPPCLVASCP